MIRSKLSLIQRVRFVYLCYKTKINFGEDQKTKKQQHLLQKALAAKKIIDFTISLPSFTDLPIKTSKYKKQLLDQLNLFKNQPLSTLYIYKLQNTSFTFKGVSVKLSDEVIQYFERMFDPMRGVNLPKHLRTQQRITQGTSNFQIGQSKQEHQPKSSEKNYQQDPSIQLKNKPFSFFPNRISTVQVFKTLYNYQSKTLLYGPPGIAKTTSIIFYCYLSSMITDYQFEYNHPIALNIPRIFYLSYKKYTQKIQDKLQLESYINNSIAYIYNHIRSQCPQKVRNQLVKSNKVTRQQFQVSYYKIKEMFQDRNTILKVVFDQFNSFIAEIRDYNKSAQGKDIVLTEQQNLKQSKINKEIYLWITMSNILSDNAILYNSSQNIQQNILGQSSRGNCIGLNLNHHSRIKKHKIDFYKILNSIQGKKQNMKAFFFEIKRCGQNQLLQKIKQIEKVYFQNDDNYFEKECDFSLTHYQIRQIFTQRKDQFTTISKYIVNQNDKIGRYNINKFIIDFIKRIQKWYITQIRLQAKKFCQQGNSFRKYLFLNTIKNLIKNKNKNQQYSIITQSQLKRFGFSDKILKQNIDQNIFQLEQKQEIEIICVYNNREILQILDFLQDFFIQQIIKEDSFFNQFVIAIKDSNQSLIGQQLQTIIIYLIKKYKSSIKLSQLTLQIDDSNKTFKHFLGDFQPLQTRFKKMIDANVPNVFAYPIQLEDQTKSSVSPSFDCIILSKYNPNSKNTKYKIYSIDFTVKSKSTDIDEKCRNAKQLIQNIFYRYWPLLERKRRAKIVEWNHYIVSKQAKLRPSIQFEASIGLGSNKKAVCQINFINFLNFDLMLPNSNMEDGHFKSLKQLIDLLKKIPGKY